MMTIEKEAQLTLARREILQREMLTRLVGANINRMHQQQQQQQQHQQQSPAAVMAAAAMAQLTSSCGGASLPLQLC